MTLRDFIHDLCGAFAAAGVVAAVCVWAPYLVQHH